MKKRIISLLLTLAILLSSVPMGTFSALAAANVSSSDIIWGTKEGITRAEWIHNLVVVFEMMVEEEALPDNYYTDFDKSHKYYEDILFAVEFGVVDVEAGDVLRPDDYATREFAASTLNFCLGYQLSEQEYTFADGADCADPASAQVALNRGWFALSEGCFRPQSIVTKEEIKIMIEDASAVQEKTIIDESYENTYQFAEDVIVVPEDTEVTEDENGMLHITDCPETILVGDRFAVYFNGIPVVYKAESVSVADEVTSISTSSVETEEAFVSLDAQGVLGTDAMEIIPAEGVEVHMEEDTSGISTFGVKKTKNLIGEVPIKFGGITGKASIKILNPYVDYTITSERAYVALCGEAEITYGLYGSAMEAVGLKKGFTVFTVNIAGVGSFDVNITVDFSGSATGTVKGFLMAGVECEKGSGIRLVKNFIQKSSYTNVEATTAVGLRVSLGVTKMPVLSGFVYADVGIKANFARKTYQDETLPHTCKHFAAYLYASYGASVSVDFKVWKVTENLTYTIYDQNNSPVRIVNHYEDGVLVPSCTRGIQTMKYFTTATSRWSGSGWSGANGAYALNADGTNFALYNYTLNENNEATITKYNGKSWSVNIPKEIDGYTVVAIGSKAFQSSSVRQIVIPDTVTSIGNRAFSACAFLCSVNLPNSLKSIGYDAFFNCDSLERINIPKSLETASFDSYYSPGVTYYTPFRDCDSLKVIEFEGGITSIIPNLFWGCTGLEKVEIPDTVTNIGANAFRECLNLTEVTIPDTVTSIGNRAFSACAFLCSVNLPNSLKSIGYDAFFNCDSLERINIPKSLETASFDSYYSPGVTYYTPFRDCDSLKIIEFEEGITSIIPNLFWGCTGLEKVEIPDTVTNIGANAFRECLNLTEVTIPDTVTSIGNRAFSACAFLCSVNLPNSLKSIGYDAFFNCDSLAKINIPKSLTSAYYDSYYSPGVTYYTPFRDCDSLKIIEFEEGITSIIPNLFWHCTGLEKVEIPNTVTHIGTNAFRGCLNLTEAIIPDTVTEIGNNAFYNCESLISITIPDSVTTINQYAFYDCKSLQSIEIPDSVTSIGTNTFDGCSSLESVKLPSTRQNIMEYMFRNCTSLKTIDLPKTVQEIRECAFYGCSSLESFTFSNGSSLKEIENHAFYGCTSLKEAVLPETTKTIGNSAFENCISLKKVYIPPYADTLGASAFMGCEVLSDVTICDYSITKIDTDTFKDCPALAAIVLPKGLTTIGTRAFMNDTTLLSVTIPESVTTIDSTAFSYPEKTIIHGKTGSYAEVYANERGFTFKDIMVPVEGLILKDGAETVTLDQYETYRVEFEVYPEDANDVITLTANNNNVTILGHDIYARYTGDTVVTATSTSGATYEFTVHIRSVKNISVVTNPTKMTYLLGEEFDKTGMVVQVNYNDGSSELVEDYTISGFDSSIEGTCKVTVEWNSVNDSTYSTTFTVEIVDPTPKLTGISINVLPTKVNYELREKLDTTGMVVMGTYTDGSVKEITEYTVSGYNALKSGNQIITVTSGDYTATFTVAVGATSTVSEITITQMPTKTAYWTGEALDTTGLVLTVTYSDGSIAEITEGVAFSGFNSTAAGTVTVTAAYLGFTATFDVKVLGNYPTANSTLSIEDTIALGLSKEHNTFTEGKYYTTGVITEVYNTTYGNMKIADEAGNILTIYGTYSADGSARYDAMDVKPVAGDIVTIYGIVGQYNGTPQVKNGWITEHIPAEGGTTDPTEPEVPADPEADSVLTVEQVLALGASKGHNIYTTGKYYVTGEITEVYNTTYGNMKITDDAGNILTIYGTYSADGSARYDAMDVKPVAGDTVTIYGIVGQYNGTAQIKNGWITEHIPAGGETEPTVPETEPTVPETEPTTPVEPEASEVVLTVDSLGLASQSYSASTATVNGVDFEWIQLGNYGNGIQVRDKDGKTSMLWNTSAFGKAIKEIRLVANAGKTVYNNPDCAIYSFGTEVGNYTYQTKLSTVSGVKEYVITPDGDYTFFKLEHDLGYTQYWDSITIVFAEETEAPVEPTEPEIEPTEPIVHEHTYGDLFAAVSPDCENSGMAAYYYCANCSKYFDENKTEVAYSDLIIPAKGHNYGQWIEEVSAEVGKTGLKAHYYDADCGKYFDVNKTVVAYSDLIIPALPEPEPTEPEETKPTVPDENAPQIVLESKKVTKGKEFTVTVEIKNNPGFSYLEVTPVISPELTLVNVENGDLIPDFTKGKQYVWVADEDVTENGTLLTFTFTVADTVGAGNYVVSFTVRTCGNYNEESVAMQVVAGNIEVIDFVYGDATGDGVVDGFDVIRLKKYLANYDYDTETSTVEIGYGADANGDGKVDGFDVIRLKKYLANYDYETGESTIVLGPQ